MIFGKNFIFYTFREIYNSKLFTQKIFTKKPDK